jgi:putative two-component system response regulator
MTPSAGKILIVDDVETSAQVLRRLLTARGYDVRVEYDGKSALAAVEQDPPDVVLLDIVMPGMSGFEVCRRLKGDPATRLIPVVLVTALHQHDSRIQGIEAGADDFLTKPPDVQELTARVRSLVRLKRYTNDLDSAESVILSLALTVEARDRYTEGHCQRLANYATALGTDLGLPDEDLAALHRGGFLHDLGKVGIPDAILLKPGPLNRAEYEAIKEHTSIGDRLCGKLRSLTRVRQIVRHHHERLDGSGYPDGLRGDAIPLVAQIMGIVDIYDALTSARPYKPAFPAQRAYEELVNEARNGWRRLDLVNRVIALSRNGRFAGLAAESRGLVPPSYVEVG